ncbi:MAG TPA: redoxin domain-containing protein, partial [Kofleriaceae bacterium]
MARNQAAFAARGVAVIGISLDEADDSRVFAGEYGIAFPLLADPGGTVSSRYTGLDRSGVSVPGIVVVRRSGEIAFRQIATSMADRLDAADIVAIVDRTLAPAARPAVEDGYAALDRIQLRFDAGGGALRIDDEWRATAFGALGA